MAHTYLRNKSHHYGSDDLFTSKFKAMVESHLKYLMEHPDTTEMLIEDNTSYLHEFAFNSLLLSLNLDRKYHWMIMRVNGLSSPHLYRSNKRSITVPNQAVMDALIVGYMSSIKTRQST